MSTPPSPTSDLAPALSEFDDILAAPSASTAARADRAHGRSAPAEKGSVLAQSASTHTEAPSFAEFAENWPLFRDPVLAALFAGLVLGVAGVFIVLRRAVFVTAAVSQAAGLGVACAFFLAIHVGLDLPPVLVAVVFAAGGALVLAVPTPARLPREATVGFIYLVTSALAIIVGALITQEAHDITSILFGSAVLVRPVDVVLVAAVGGVTLTALVASTRSLAFAGFDPDAARVQGVPVRSLEVTFWLIVAAEIAVATRALGALPVFAFAVLPALGALRVSRRLPQALLLGGALGAFSGGAGYVCAFLLELPVGAAQATLAAVMALACLALGRVWR